MTKLYRASAPASPLLGAMRSPFRAHGRTRDL